MREYERKVTYQERARRTWGFSGRGDIWGSGEKPPKKGENGPKCSWNSTRRSPSQFTPNLHLKKTDAVENFGMDEEPKGDAVSNAAARAFR